MTTTTPKPTAAEHDLALRNARALVRPVADHAVPHDPIRVMLATAVLDLHAKLTASEAAREALREALREYGFCAYCQGAYDGCIACVRTGLAQWARDALAADVKAKEKTMTEPKCPECGMPAQCKLSCSRRDKPTPYQPKPGERVRLVKSPDGRFNGQDGLMVSVEVGDSHPWHWHPDGEKQAFYVPFDSTWEPVEPSAPVGQVSAVDAAYILWGEEPWPEGVEHHVPDPKEAFTAGYEAGRASEAAARVEWLKSDAARVELNAVTENGELKVDLERVRAELAEARGWQEAVVGLQARARRVPTRDELVRVIRDELRQPVPASDNRTASEACADAVLRLFAEADAAKSPVTGNEPPEHVVVATRLPDDHPERCVYRADTEDAETEMVFERTGPQCEFPATHLSCVPYTDSPTCPEHKCRCARFVGDWSHYRAQQRAAATPDPDDDRINRKLSSQLPWTRVPASTAAEEEFAPFDEGDARLAGMSVPEPASAWLKRTVEELTTARPVEVREESSPGRWEVRSPGQTWFETIALVRNRDYDGLREALRVYGWPLRRNCITDPTPKAPEHTVLVPERLEALTARVEELELQARVMRRWANSSIPAPVWARIEREERERAK